MARRTAVSDNSPHATLGPLLETNHLDLHPRATARPAYAMTYYINGVEGTTPVHNV
jgi:hypothetical protein